MCTVVILFRPGHAWPVIIAANRDEMIARPWLPPARHWPDRPRVVAGRDELAGGTWLGLSDGGVLASMLNRRGSLGPKAGMRSRGELPLEALDHADARAAADALAHIEPRSYRSFNMVIADRTAAFWLRLKGADEGANGGGDRRWTARAGESPRALNDAPLPGPAVESFPIPAGLSMITAYERNDPASHRIRHYLPRFERAVPPDPGAGDWAEWQALLASRERAPQSGPRGAMTIAPDQGYGTVSSSLIALPSRADTKPVWLFAPGAPGSVPFAPVAL
ncbi:MAG: NRDE family protein [Rhodospirillales bacterium]|nr:NRDE family protein [Rhodospirillales bacterium]